MKDSSIAAQDARYDNQFVLSTIFLNGGDFGSSLGIWTPDPRDDRVWKDVFLGTAEELNEQRTFALACYDAVLHLAQRSVDENRPLDDVAREVLSQSTEALENAFVEIRESNREAWQTAVAVEEAFREAGAIGIEAYRDRVHVIDAAVSEIAGSGSAWLSEFLKGYANRPNPIDAFAIVCGIGEVNPREASELGQVARANRCIYIGDGPSFADQDSMRAAARSTSGSLAKYRTREEWGKSVFLLCNRLVAERRLSPKETSDCLVHGSAIWFGKFLNRIAQGESWLPPSGYGDVARGMIGVEVDVRVGKDDHSTWFTDNNLGVFLPLTNPGNRAEPEACDCVAYGVKMLYGIGEGMQVGEALILRDLSNYAIHQMHQHGIYAMPLKQARNIVAKRLKDFVQRNCGPGELFQTGSWVSVRADVKRSALMVEFNVSSSVVATKGKVTVTKPHGTESLENIETEFTRSS